MPSLQIRDLPEPLHRLLQHRAQTHNRSLSQQALADLEAIAGGEPLNAAARCSIASPDGARSLLP